MDLKNSYFLVKRGADVYRAKVSSLSSVILFNESKNDFYDYLKSVEAEIENLTATIDMILIPKNEMKSTFVTKESVNELTNNGNYVLSSDAKKAVEILYSNYQLSGNDKWYDKTLNKCVDKLNDGYERNVGMMMKSAITPEDIDKEKAGESPGTDNAISWWSYNGDI